MAIQKKLILLDRHAPSGAREDDRGLAYASAQLACIGFPMCVPSPTNCTPALTVLWHNDHGRDTH
ncbi:MAG: hypothetical protein ACK5UY_04705, partial [Holosporales bacterium]